MRLIIAGLAICAAGCTSSASLDRQRAYTACKAETAKDQIDSCVETRLTLLEADRKRQTAAAQARAKPSACEAIGIEPGSVADRDPGRAPCADNTGTYLLNEDFNSSN